MIKAHERDWNPSPDFHILFLPRSGSHMLVDALNSHPEIDCTHSDQGHHGKGNLKGHAQCVVDKNIKKAIILTRNSKDRTDSFFTDIANVAGTNHVYKPGVVIHRNRPEKAQNRYKSQSIKNEDFFERAVKVEQHLVVDYYDLTENKDIREIPEKWSHAICDFLGVEKRMLTTRLHKPKVIG